MSRLVLGVPGLLSAPSSLTSLDLSAFINFSDPSLIENAVRGIEGKPPQKILDTVSSGLWFDFVGNFNTLNDSGNPVSNGSIRTFRSVTSNKQLTGSGSLLATKSTNLVRFSGDYYQSDFEQTPYMTYVLVGTNLRSSRAEYLAVLGDYVALGIGRPRNTIAYRDVSGQWRLSNRFVPDNNVHMVSWQMEADRVRFYYDGVMGDEQSITPIPNRLVTNASWFGLSRNGQCNFNGYGLFVFNQPVDISEVHCFADRFYGLGLGLG